MVSGKVNPQERTQRNRRVRVAWWILLLVYPLINLLFIAKYVPRYGISPFWACVAYGALAAALFLVADSGVVDRMLRGRATYVAAVVVASVVLLLIMLRVDPEGTRSGRYSAANEWLRRLLHADFPYRPPHLHSGFPGLFAIMLPFHLLGNVGLLQIISFIILALILRHHAPAQAASGLLLVLTAPAFLYEIMVRSDLFSNVVLVIGAVCLIEELAPGASVTQRLLLGVLGGLVLSTRAVAFVIWITYLVFVFRRQRRIAVELLAASLLTFTATLLPFWFWDPGAFARFGPLTSERLLAQLPVFLGVVLLLVAVFLSLRAQSLASMFLISGTVLFVAAAVSFLSIVASTGLAEALWGDRFDITYFCFALPLLVAGYKLLPAGGPRAVRR
ncbi:MAG: hypothetical protein AB1792_06390 [Candidatus Zixiibacteriota bacterium]